MKVKSKKLFSSHEREVLALFFESEEHKVLKKLVANEKDKAIKHGFASQDFETLQYYKGFVSGLEHMEEQLKRVHQDVQKEKEKKKKQ